MKQIRLLDLPVYIELNEKGRSIKKKNQKQRTFIKKNI
jgi:hypothetical protein